MPQPEEQDSEVYLYECHTLEEDEDGEWVPKVTFIVTPVGGEDGDVG